MKELLLLLCLGIAVHLTCYADTTLGEKMLIEDTLSPGNMGPRSIPASADVWFKSANKMLTVQLTYTYGVAAVNLLDDQGANVYQDSVGADGSKQSITLPDVEPGAYFVVISCNGYEWRAELAL